MKALLLGALFSATIAGAAFAGGPTLRITGGKDVPKGKYGWTVALRGRTDGAPYCVGSVVGDYWILTAEHCAIERPLDQMYVSTGVDLSTGEPFEVDRLVRRGDGMDVALLRTKKKITSAQVPAIEVRSSLLPAGTRVAIAGWGYFQMTTNQLPRYLQMRTFKTMDREKEREECKRGPKEFCFRVTLDNYNKPRSPQRGDSGAGVIMLGHKKRTLVGVYKQMPADRTKLFGLAEDSYYFEDWLYRTIGRK